ncbi:MAG: hypothetical protein K2I73_04125 [Eubacterium sp.]|nr:hypothetical protein [Eubacterium sp.]
MNKKNLKYYILIALMVIVSMSIPISAHANSSSDAEWEKVSQSIEAEGQSIIAEGERIKQEVSRIEAENAKKSNNAKKENEEWAAKQVKKQSEWESSVAQKNAEWSSSVAAAQAERQSSIAAAQEERQSNIAQNNAKLLNSFAEEQSKIKSEWDRSVAQKHEEFESKVAQSREEFEKKEKKTLSIIIPLIVLVVGGAIIFNVIIYRKAFKDNKSSKTTFVPFQPITRDNENHIPINAIQKIEGKCMYCGKDISSDSEFCSFCGKKQVEEYVKVFNRYNMNNAEFIASINSWLASNPKIANVKCEFNTRTGYGLLANKYLLDSVALKYELFKNNNENQYGIVELKKFGLYQKSSDALLSEWQAYNPNAVVLKRSGGRHSRGKVGHELFWGIGAKNNTQLFVFFKFKRNP